MTEDDEVTGRYLLPPDSHEVPLEVLAHRIALREQKKRIDDIENAIKGTMSKVIWAVIGGSGTVVIAIVSAIWWLAVHFAAIETNTQRIGRLERTVQHDSP